MTDEANTCVEILKKAARIGVSDCQYCPAYTVCPTGTAGWNNECLLETAADLIESLSAQLEENEKELEEAMHCLIKLGLILREYPRAVTNGCAYESYKELQNYVMRGPQEVSHA